MTQRPPHELRKRRTDSQRRSYRSRRLALAASVGVIALAITLVSALAFNSNARTRSSSHAGRRAARSGHLRPGVTPPSRLAQQLEANESILKYTSYISRGVPRTREVALTFDDGPGPYTLQILSVLERFHTKATFFEIGKMVNYFSEATAKLAEAGMVIGDHTEKHSPLGTLTAQEQALEIDEAANEIQSAGAPRPLLFRPPYGSFNATTLRLLRARDLLMVLWTVDTNDYQRPGVQQIVSSALDGARPGAIILFHDGGGDRSETVAALPHVIEGLERSGYRLVSVPELLEADPPPVGQPLPVNLSGD